MGNKDYHSEPLHSERATVCHENPLLSSRQRPWRKLSASSRSWQMKEEPKSNSYESELGSAPPSVTRHDRQALLPAPPPSQPKHQIARWHWKQHIHRCQPGGTHQGLLGKETGSLPFQHWACRLTGKEGPGPRLDICHRNCPVRVVVSDFSMEGL